MESLNPEQQSAITHSGSPLLIIAGAGTGKTTVVTQRIAHLIAQGIPPGSIVALTFTEKAAYGMQTRVDALLDSTFSDTTISTFHAFCQQILERYGLDMGIPTPFKLYTPAQSWRLCKENLARFDLDYYRPKANPTRLIGELIKHFSKCKDELITPKEYLAFAAELKGDTDLVEYRRSKTIRVSEGDDELEELARIDEVANAYHVYQQVMLENNALDFGDLMLYTHELLKTRPHIQKLLQEQYTHILVDEFQDTNWAQYQLLRQLAGDGTNATVVADDDQSIYKWRGASVSNVLQYTKDYANTKTVVLTTNYRSTQNILDAAYTLITKNNPNRLEVQQNIDKKLAAHSKEQGSVTHKHYQTVEREAQALARSIVKISQNGSPLSEIALLVRANAHTEPFIAALAHAGIPYQYQAARGLLKTSVSLDCLAIVRALINNYNDAALYRLLHSAPFVLSHEDESILWFTAERKGTRLIHVLQKVKGGVVALSQDGNQKISLLLKLLNEHATLSKKSSVGVVLLSFLEKSGYLKALTKGQEEGDPESTERLLHLRGFFELIEQCGNEHTDTRIKTFIEFIDDMTAAGEDAAAQADMPALDAVQVLTIHSAKGLEFDHVFIANVVERRFPSDNRSDKIAVPEPLVKESIPQGDHHIEEERRLLYVALTRARKSATLLSSNSYGGKQKRKISRFIVELGLADSQTQEPTEKLEISVKKETPKAEKIDLPIPKSFSHSQLNTYKNCPLQYKFAYILKIPTRGRPHLTFGNTMHGTLQAFYERVKELNNTAQPDLFSAPAQTPAASGVGVPSLDELLRLYEEKWRDDWFYTREQHDNYFEEGKRMLQLFYQSNAAKGWSIPAYIEKGFNLRIKGRTIRGRIDRVDKTDAGFEIIDYKTGKPKERLSSDDKQQLYLYQLAARSIPELSSGSIAALTFYYLENGDQKSFVGTEQDVEDYQNSILTIIEKIEERDFKANPSSWKCGSCDFRNICEFRA